MAFDGTEGRTITLTVASGMTENWRSTHSGERKAIFFGKDKLVALLNQTDCQGLRIYFAIDDNDEYDLVVVGADSEEDDILASILDTGVPCPTACGASNDLNS